MFNPQAKLLHHPDRVKVWLDKKHTWPILVEVAPTGYCNASCPWCFFKDKQSKEQIKTATMLKALEDMSKHALRAVNWSGGGEPTLHPDFNIFVQYAASRGLKQGLFTNGLQEIPNQECFEWIRISMTDKGFDPIIKPKVPFGICWNNTRKDIDLIRECLRARDFGASYFQVRPALSGYYGNQYALSIPTHLKMYETDSFKVYVTPYKYRECTKAKQYSECYGYHFCPSIDWNGHLLTCLYFSGREGYILGDLNKKDFYAIWKSIPESVQVIHDCQNCCKLHEINKILYASTHIKHINFL